MLVCLSSITLKKIHFTVAVIFTILLHLGALGMLGMSILILLIEWCKKGQWWQYMSSLEFRNFEERSQMDWILMTGIWMHMMNSSNGNIFRVTGHLCGEFPVTGEFPSQRPVTWSFDVVPDLRPNQQFSKQARRQWSGTPSRSLWRHCSEKYELYARTDTLEKSIPAKSI